MKNNPKITGRWAKFRSNFAGSAMVAGLACASTLLALPAEANFAIPNDPLTLATRIAPNILFILDDSGSMAFNYMPDNVPATTTPDVSDQAYTRNTLYYNPAIVYQPWTMANGNRMTGGTSYSAAYGSFNLVGGGTIDLGSSTSCRRYNYNNGTSQDEYSSGATQVCGGVQTFYVPKNLSDTTGAYLGAGTNYYRYQIQEGTGSIIRSEYGAVTTSTVNVAVSPASGTTGSATVVSSLASVPSGKRLTITINNTGNEDLKYTVKDPSGSNVCSSSITDGDSENCVINFTSSGVYKVEVSRSSKKNTRYTLSALYTDTNRCGTGTGSNDWINCVAALPTSTRNLAQELENYATWFSYHRTRIKAAKAGASEAFKPLGSKVRVGFRTIWNRSNLNIPVNDGNDGRFVDVSGNLTTNSRSDWYNRLFGVIGYSSTPLHGALDSAGQYYSDTSGTGPYGPETGSNQYACRQNFSILTTDGYWNNASNYGGTLSGGNDGTWTGGVGEQDNTNGANITGSRNPDYQYTPRSPYKDSNAGTLADVAMKYWKSDLTSLANVVPTSDADPAFWQHMVTFGISIGLSGPSGITSVADVAANYVFNNPNDAEDGDRIDDLLHASLNGHGEFVSASSPQAFSQGLSSALEAIAQRTTSYSNVAASSVSLETGSQVFNASFVSGVWTGKITARGVSSSGVSSTVSWTSTIPAWSTRKIFTSDGSAGTSFPTTTQTTLLTRNGGPIDYAVSGVDNAKYIKGEQRLEGSNVGQLRVRQSLLGDIIGSSPAYVKETATLYVAANDGMLHAFDARNGQEQFAYVPNIINWANFSSLSRGDYSHRFLVDGPVVVSDRLLTPNKNILVGTLGRGGKGLYSLDVSSPSTAAASIVKWERAETPSGNMGLILSEPMLTNTSGGAVSVVVGNGLNSSHDRAVLLVLDAATGSVIREIDTGAGSATAPNGLTSVNGVFGPDGKTLAYAYAGDMLGNVWKFDLTSTTPSRWSVTKLFQTATGQPITGGLALAFDPATYKRWVLFGTGSFITSGDVTGTQSTQAMYGVIDDNSGSTVPMSDLTQRTISVTSSTVSGFPVRAFEAYAALPVASKGWYINLPETGERIVQDAQVAAGYLVTASMTPVGTGCGADGSGYINAVNAFTGTSKLGKSFFDLDANGQTDGQAVNGTLPVGSVNLGNGMPTKPSILRGLSVVGGTGDVGGGGAVNVITNSQPVWTPKSWLEFRE